MAENIYIPIAKHWWKDNPKPSSISQAISSNDIGRLTKEIRSAKDANQLDDSGMTLLMLAVRSHRPGICEFLIQKGADPNGRSALYTFGELPLNVATSLGEADVVLMLLRAGANVNLTNLKRESPIMNSVSYGYIDIVRILLNNGANPNTENLAKSTPLMEAIFQKHPDIEKLLLKNGADPNRTDINGWTALRYAVQSNCLECVKNLTKYNVMVDLPDKMGKTPFLAAVDSGYDEIAGILLGIGASKFVKTAAGDTAMAYAKRRKDKKMERLLSR